MTAGGVERIDGRTERWREHRERRREQFIDAAFEALREHGPDVNLEQIAAAAGTTKPKLYRHFDTKSDLVEAIAERALAKVVSNLASGLDPQASLREALSHGLDGYLQFVEEHPQVVRFLMENSDRASQGMLLSRARAIAKLFIAIASADLEDDHVPTDEIGPLAHALVGALAGATDWWVLQGPESHRSRPRLVAQLTIVLSSAAEAQLSEWGVAFDLDRPGTLLTLAIPISAPAE
ncbi:MAG TPA: TetR/AcrR family transcriptional regulator [Nocardioidaceae bacterium]|nr:TetR/AcrR family transcriptional regulator [Nocardioidaceae bacterium]